MTSEVILKIKSLSGSFQPDLREFFAQDANRGHRFSVSAGGLLFDYSKHWVTEPVVVALTDALREAGWEAAVKRLTSGEPVNVTENRAALHMALRAKPEDHPLISADAIQQADAERARCAAFAKAIRSGARVGATGLVFTDVVNIGIGGSDLGPLMVAEALSPWVDGPRAHFISNLDGAHAADVMKRLSPETTLVLVASKSFTTQETLHNASKLKDWIVDALGESAVADHFAALSSRPDQALAFGIPESSVFGFADWVGGRFSVWSSIGLVLMIALGPRVFERLLAGARDMDQHFLEAPLTENIPVLMGLLGVWYRCGFGCQSHAILPYAQRLAHFPAYLQQLEMESNGKRVSLDGSPVTSPTAPIIWGAVGTNGQHAFHQLLHQGTVIVPADFIVTANPVDTDLATHRMLNDHALAQAEVLAFGQTEAESVAVYGESASHLASHRACPGNRPSSLWLLPELNPESLGALMAAYEHKVFVQSVCWGINAFDQWGVELGKTMAAQLAAGDESVGSSSTQAARQWLKKHQN